MKRFTVALVALTLAGPAAAQQEPNTPAVVDQPAGSPRFPLRSALIVMLPEGVTPETLLAGPGQAVEHSDAYYTRLTIHRYGSYAILPLFGAQYYLGSKLIDGGAEDWVKPTHRAVAFTVAGVFALNTVTGVWNLIESRNDKEGRGRRFLHAALMLAADAGFAYTGTLAGDASLLGESAEKHRNAALTSMGIATAGAIVMWTR